MHDWKSGSIAANNLLHRGLLAPPSTGRFPSLHQHTLIRCNAGAPWTRRTGATRGRSTAGPLGLWSRPKPALFGSVSRDMSSFMNGVHVD
ncbi:hypothetical protein VZT92_006987 [Zoarces viviparus]|uniref:Uncharacterized protein n=1 Tax=Zoarces viviparus TaxID=48416 RepID=A0AAW1FIP0_ZOAVI